MAQVIFYGKPGCKGNARQQQILLDSGHEVEFRNLLSYSWTAASLRPFFGILPVHEWFNRSAARVKSGQVDPFRLSESQALQLMLGEPVLIRRPLLQVGEERRAGFSVPAVSAWIGLLAETVPPDYADGCLMKGPASHCHS